MKFDEKLLEFPVIRELIAEKTVCQLGARRIYAMQPFTERKPLMEAVESVKEMMALVENNQEPPIHGMRDITLHLGKAKKERAALEPQELLDVKDSLMAAAETRRFFEPFQQEFPELHALAMPLQGLPSLSRSIDEKIAPNATVRDTASETLARLRADITATESTIQKELNRMVRAFKDSGDLQDDFFTLRNDRYVLPVKTANRGKIPGIIHDSSNSGETVFIEPFAILEYTNRLADLRVMEREEIYRILLRVTGHVRDEINILLTNLDLLGDFDYILAKARFGVAHSCAFPSIVDDGKPLNLIDAHHPLLKISSPTTSHPLNLSLNFGDQNLVISGPNAGGKTTALKTLGLNCLMAQCAIPVPMNPRSRLPLFQDILANIGDEQNILEGQSTFSAQIKRIGQILEIAGPGSLVLLDELGTATDPSEGGALAVAILEYLADRGSLTVVSSHLSPLKVWAHNNNSARNASFRLSDIDRKPTYTLTLDVIGISEAIVVAEQVGLPKEILEKAKLILPEGGGDANSLLLSLQEKENRLERLLREHAATAKELEQKAEYLDLLETELREEKRTYKLRLMDEKEKELASLRAKVESLIAKQPSRVQLNESRKEIEQYQADVKKQKTRPDTTNTHPTGGLTKGLRVRVKSLNDEGVIELVDDSRKQARIAIGKVVVSVKYSDIERLPQKPKAKEDEKPKLIFYKRPQFADSVLDLHGKRVEEALNITDKFIDDGLAAGLNSIKVMHGQGSGALQRALHEFLRTHREVKQYRYASAEEGGAGVTIVIFK